MSKNRLTLSGDKKVNTNVVDTLNQVLDIYDEIATNPFSVKRGDLQKQAREFAHRESEGLEDIKLAAQAAAQANQLAVLGTSRKNDLKALYLIDEGFQSLRDLLADVKEQDERYEPAACALSSTYYRQRIQPWEASIAAVQADLQGKANYEKALQKTYLETKNQWSYIQAVSIYGGVNSPTTFDEFYDQLRTTFGFTSSLHSETSKEAQALYDECKGIFNNVQREDFRNSLKEWWDNQNRDPGKDEIFQKTQEKLQERFVTRALQRFEKIEEEYSKQPSKGKEILLQHYAAKLIAVMTLADDRESKDGLHKGIPAAWLNGQKKEDLLRRAQHAVRIANHLKLSEIDSVKLDLALSDAVIGVTWQERKEQENKFYQQYVEAYQAAVKNYQHYLATTQSAAISSSRKASLLEAVRQTGLSLEYVCQKLAKSYRDEISYYQSKINAANKNDKNLQKSYREYHEGLVNKALDDYLNAGTSKAKIRAKLRFEEYRKLYNQNYEQTFGTYKNNKLTAKVKNELEQAAIVTVFSESAVIDPVTRRVLFRPLIEKNQEVTATKLQLFEINQEWSRVFGCLPEHLINNSYRLVMSNDFTEYLARDLILTHYFTPIYNRYQEKLKEKVSLKKEMKDKWLDEYKACVSQLLYRIDFCSKLHPDWYVENQENFQKLKEAFPEFRKENHFGLRGDDLKEERKIKAQLEDNFTLLSQKIVEFRKTKDKYAALSAEDVQALTACLTLSLAALNEVGVNTTEVEKKRGELKQEAETLIDTILNKISYMKEDVDPLGQIFVTLDKCLQYTERDGKVVCSYQSPKNLYHDYFVEDGKVTGMFSRLSQAASNYGITLPANLLETFIEFTLRLGTDAQRLKLSSYFQLKDQIIPLVYVEKGSFFAPIVPGIDWDLDLPSEGQANQELVGVMQPLSAVLVTLNLLAQKAEQFSLALNEGAQADDLSKLPELERAIKQLAVLQERALDQLQKIQGRTNLASYFSGNRDLVMALQKKLTTAIPEMIDRAKSKWKESANKLAQAVETKLFTKKEGLWTPSYTKEQLSDITDFVKNHADETITTIFLDKTNFTEFVCNELIDKASQYKVENEISINKVYQLLDFSRRYVDKTKERAFFALYQLLQKPYLLVDDENIREALLPIFPNASEAELYEFLGQLDKAYPHLFKGLKHNSDKDNQHLEKMLSHDEDQKLEYQKLLADDHKKATEIKALLVEFLLKHPDHTKNLDLRMQVSEKPVTSYAEVVGYVAWLAEYGSQRTKSICNELKTDLITFAEQYTGELTQTYHELFTVINQMQLDFSDTEKPGLLATLAFKRLQYLCEHHADALVSDPAVYLQSNAYSGTEEERKKSRTADFNLIKEHERDDTFITQIQAYLAKEITDAKLDELALDIKNAALHDQEQRNKLELCAALISTYDTDGRRARYFNSQIEQWVKDDVPTHLIVERLNGIHHLKDEESFRRVLETKLIYQLSMASSQKEFDAYYALCNHWGYDECRSIALITWLSRQIKTTESNDLLRHLTSFFAVEIVFANEHRLRVQDWLAKQLKKTDHSARVQQNLDALILEYGNDKQKSDFVIRKFEECLLEAAEAVAEKKPYDVNAAINAVLNKLGSLESTPNYIIVAIQDWIQSKFKNTSDELRLDEVNSYFPCFYEFVLRFGKDEEILEALPLQLLRLEKQVEKEKLTEVFKNELARASQCVVDKELFASKMDDWQKHRHESVFEFLHLCYLIRYDSTQAAIAYLEENKATIKEAILANKDRALELSEALSTKPDLIVRTYHGKATGWCPFAQEVCELLGESMDSYRKDQVINCVSVVIEYPETAKQFETASALSKKLFEKNAAEFNARIAPAMDFVEINKKYGKRNAKRLVEASEAYINRFDINSHIASSASRFISVVGGAAKQFVQSISSFVTKMSKFLFGVGDKKKTTFVSNKVEVTGDTKKIEIKSPVTSPDIRTGLMDRYEQKRRLVENLADSVLPDGSVAEAINDITIKREQNNAPHAEDIDEAIVKKSEIAERNVFVEKENLTKEQREEKVMLLDSQEQVAEHIRRQCFINETFSDDNFRKIEQLVNASFPILIVDAKVSKGFTNPLAKQLISLVEKQKEIYPAYKNVVKAISDIGLLKIEQLNDDMIKLYLSSCTIENLETLYLHLDTATKFELHCALKDLIARIPEHGPSLMRQRLGIMADILDSNPQVALRNLAYSYVAKHFAALRALDLKLALQACVQGKAEDRLKLLLNFYFNSEQLTDTERVTQFEELINKHKEVLIEHKEMFEPLVNQLFDCHAIHIIKVLANAQLTTEEQALRCKDVLTANQKTKELATHLNDETRWKWNDKITSVELDEWRKWIGSVEKISKFADGPHLDELREAIQKRFLKLLATIEDYNSRINQLKPESKPDDIVLPILPLQLLQTLYTNVYQSKLTENEEDNLGENINKVTIKTLAEVRKKLSLANQATWLNVNGDVADKKLYEKYFASALHFVKVFGSESDKQEIYERINLSQLSYCKWASSLGVTNQDKNTYRRYFGRQEKLGTYFDENEKYLDHEGKPFLEKLACKRKLSDAAAFFEATTKSWVALPILDEFRYHFTEWRDRFSYTLLTFSQFSMDESVSGRMEEIADMRNELVQHGTSSIKKAAEQNKLSPRAQKINNELCGNNYPVRVLVKKSAKHVNAVRKLANPEHQSPEKYEETLKEIALYLNKHQALFILLTTIGKLEKFIQTLDEKKTREVNAFTLLLADMRGEISHLKQDVANIKPINKLSKEEKAELSEEELKRKKVEQQLNLQAQIKKVNDRAMAASIKINQAIQEKQSFVDWKSNYLASQSIQTDDITLMKIFEQTQNELQLAWNKIEEEMISPQNYLAQINAQHSWIGKYRTFLNEHSELQTEQQKIIAFKAHMAITVEAENDPIAAVITLKKIAHAVGTNQNEKPQSMMLLEAKGLSLENLEASVGFSKDFFASLCSLLEKVVNNKLTVTDLEKLPTFIKEGTTPYFIVSKEQKKALTAFIEGNHAKLTSLEAKKLIEFAQKSMTIADLIKQDNISQHIIKKEDIVAVNKAFLLSRALERAHKAFDEFIKSHGKSLEELTPKTLEDLKGMDKDQRRALENKLDIVIAKLTFQHVEPVSALAIVNLMDAIDFIAKDKKDILVKTLKDLADDYTQKIIDRFNQLNNPKVPGTLEAYLNQIKDMTNKESYRKKESSQNKGSLAGAYYVVANYGSKENKLKVANIIRSCSEPYVKVVEEIIRNPDQTLEKLIQTVNQESPAASDKRKISYEMLGKKPDQKKLSIDELGLTLPSMEADLLEFNRTSRQLLEDIRKESAEKDLELLTEIDSLLKQVDLDVTSGQIDKSRFAKLRRDMIDIKLNADSFARIRLVEILINYKAKITQLNADVEQQLDDLPENFRKNFAASKNDLLGAIAVWEKNITTLEAELIRMKSSIDKKHPSYRKVEDLEIYLKEYTPHVNKLIAIANFQIAINTFEVKRKSVYELIDEVYPESLQVNHMNTCLESQRVSGRMHSDAYQPVMFEFVELQLQISKKEEKLEKAKQYQSQMMAANPAADSSEEWQNSIAELDTLMTLMFTRKGSTTIGRDKAYAERIKEITGEKLYQEVEYAKLEMKKAEDAFKEALSKEEKQKEITEICNILNTKLEEASVSTQSGKGSTSQSHLSQRHLDVGVKEISNAYIKLKKLSTPKGAHDKFLVLQSSKNELLCAERALQKFKEKNSPAEISKRKNEEYAKWLSFRIQAIEFAIQGLKDNFNEKYKKALMDHMKQLVEEIINYYKNPRTETILLEQQLTIVAQAFANYLHMELSKFKLEATENPQGDKAAFIKKTEAQIEKDKQERFRERNYLDNKVSADSSFEDEASLNYAIAQHLGLYDCYGYTLLGNLMNALASVITLRNANTVAHIKSTAIPIVQEQNTFVDLPNDEAIAATFRNLVRNLEHPLDIKTNKMPAIVGSYIPGVIKVGDQQLAMDKDLFGTRLDKMMLIKSYQIGQREGHSMQMRFV